MGSSRVSYRTALTQGQEGKEYQQGQQSGIMHALRVAYAAGNHGPGELHPFQRADGEKLPPGWFRNSDGLLVRGAASFNVMNDDLVVLEREICFLRDHVIIARTTGGDLMRQEETTWLSSLRPRASPGCILGHQRAGPGLYYLRTDCPATTQRLLLDPLHQFAGGTMVYQPWKQGLNPRHPKGLLTPF